MTTVKVILVLQPMSLLPDHVTTIETSCKMADPERPADKKTLVLFVCCTTWFTLLSGLKIQQSLFQFVGTHSWSVTKTWLLSTKNQQPKLRVIGKFRAARSNPEPYNVINMTQDKFLAVSDFLRHRYVPLRPGQSENSLSQRSIPDSSCTERTGMDLSFRL
ncbi:hypothetical protein RRG08_036402 [Elysia crispata]|uniref:Uncharacterized protein n=1 Tax=Elysia crispata TaxID=231223 RepID=A0AAE0ZKE0_9GAST|nr:hypothetical protein RRG08_036402 [Elysia crispata]